MPHRLTDEEDAEVTEKETAREPRKVESPKKDKAETKGKAKGKGKKGQRLNEITEPPEEQWTGVDRWMEQWSEQSWNAEADTASGRDDDWYTADSNSQTSAAAEEFQRASICDLRLSNLGFARPRLVRRRWLWVCSWTRAHF